MKLKENDFRQIIKEEAKERVKRKIAQNKPKMENLKGFVPSEFSYLKNHEKSYISIKE